MRYLTAPMINNFHRVYGCAYRQCTVSAEEIRAAAREINPLLQIAKYGPIFRAPPREETDSVWVDDRPPLQTALEAIDWYLDEV